MYVPGESATDVSMPYVLDYSTKGMIETYDMMLDDEGIVTTSHYVDHPGGHGYYYSPTKISHYGLGALNDAINGRGGGGLREYRLHLRWMMEHYSEELGGIVWRVPSTNPKYGLDANYVSCIAQGLALSLLARAESDKERARAKELSEAALAPLRVRVEDGGLLGEGRWGPCFEEYPCVPYSHVLNGFVFCLSGLFDCYSAYGSKQARDLFELGLGTFREMTKVWFVRGWARYDLRDLYTGDIPNLATRHYQYLHADQMKGLATITGDEYWDTLGRRFEYQALNPLGFAYSYWCKARRFL